MFCPSSCIFYIPFWGEGKFVTDYSSKLNYCLYSEVLKFCCSLFTVSLEWIVYLYSVQQLRDACTCSGSRSYVKGCCRTLLYSGQLTEISYVSLWPTFWEGMGGFLSRVHGRMRLRVCCTNSVGNICRLSCRKKERPPHYVIIRGIVTRL